MDTLLNPLGWSPWGDSNFAQDTVYYGEYQNYRPGASTTNRVKWPGFHVITSPTEEFQFIVTRLLSGPTWLGSTNVPFTSVNGLVIGNPLGALWGVNTFPTHRRTDDGCSHCS
ncbi:hypothetical protein Fmac_005782 [Flemingia macrophylla]|uniref:Pectinesterase catalytic domain-containing protein n=1 Tax=Flemingia macrophylla TaxID=520843 RepID=A0ABD1N8R6_9FABA